MKKRLRKKLHKRYLYDTRLFLCSSEFWMDKIINKENNILLDKISFSLDKASQKYNLELKKYFNIYNLKYKIQSESFENNKFKVVIESFEFKNIYKIFYISFLL